MQQNNKKFQTFNVSAIACMHFLHDIYTSFFAPILPLIIERLGLSLLQAGSLKVCMEIPSLANPFLGAFADQRRIKRLLLVITPGLTATLMSLIGVVSGYLPLAILLMAAGLSQAAFHVSAPVILSNHAGEKVGRGMSFFMLGGELARTLGPLIAVWSISAMGTQGIWRLMFAGWAASAILAWRIGLRDERTNSAKTTGISAMLQEMKLIIGGVLGILFCRAFMAGAITTYLPTFLYKEGHSLWAAGISLAVFEGAGALGVLISGTLSDRLGRRQVLAAAVGVAPFMLLAMLYARGTLLFVALMGLGFFTLASGPVLMAVMLENAGSNRAAANGMYMALSFAVRSTVILLVGFLSDLYGMRLTYHVCAVTALLALPFTLLIPQRRH